MRLCINHGDLDADLGFYVAERQQNGMRVFGDRQVWMTIKHVLR